MLTLATCIQVKLMHMESTGLGVAMYWQAECTPVDCVTRKGMMLKMAVPLMMSQESEHWC